MTVIGAGYAGYTSAGNHGKIVVYKIVEAGSIYTLYLYIMEDDTQEAVRSFLYAINTTNQIPEIEHQICKHMHVDLHVVTSSGKGPVYYRIVDSNRKTDRLTFMKENIDLFNLDPEFLHLFKKYFCENRKCVNNDKFMSSS